MSHCKSGVLPVAGCGYPAFHIHVGTATALDSGGSSTDSFVRGLATQCTAAVASHWKPLQISRCTACHLGGVVEISGAGPSTHYSQLKEQSGLEHIQWLHVVQTNLDRCIKSQPNRSDLPDSYSGYEDMLCHEARVAVMALQFGR